MLKPRMSSKFTIFFLTQIFSFLFIFLSRGSFTEAQSNDSKTTNIGVIIDAYSRIGKEQKIAMEIAAQNFNSNTSNMQKLVLHFKDPGRDPLQAVYAGDMSGGWIPVLRQRSGGGAQGNEARHGVFTVFMDNIPSAMDAKALFKLFSNFRIVKEAFIPYKRRQATNSRFGFVRYDCQVAVAIAIQKGNGLLVDDKVLEVKVAAYDRNNRDEQSRGKPQPSRRVPHTNNISGKAAFVGHRSFAEVLKGDIISTVGEESIEIQAFEEGNGWLYESAIIRFNTEYPTHIISKALKEKGLEQIEVRKGKGRDIILSFKSQAELYSNIGQLQDWFKDWSLFVSEWKPGFHL